MYIADWYTYCIIYGACLYKSYDMNELHFQRIIVMYFLANWSVPPLNSNLAISSQVS